MMLVLEFPLQGFCDPSTEPTLNEPQSPTIDPGPRERIKRKLPKDLLRPKPPVRPGAKPDGALRLMTLNLAHGRKRGPHQLLQRKPRLERNLHLVGDLIDEAEPDVIALQEADGPSSWSGNFCHVSRLSEVSGLEHHYRGPHTQRNFGRLQLQCGTAILSRLPILQQQSVTFGQNWRDNKGFVVGEIQVPQWNDTTILVASVHLDFLAPQVRRRQVQQIIEVLGERKHPLVLLGDLNCSALEDPKTLQLLLHDLNLEACDLHIHRPTYPSYRPLRRLDWILASPELRFANPAMPLEAQVSDHLAVLADLVPAT